MSESLNIGFFTAQTRYEPIPKSVDTIYPLPQLQRARPFYFEDSQVVLQASHSIIMFPSALLPSLYSQVDGEKYKIHCYFLTRKSEFFKDLFLLPQPGESASVEGSDDNPIMLPETPTLKFENFL